MDREKIYEEFENLDKKASQGGGLDKIEKQHESGRMTARERIDMLLDKGTFNELDKFVTHRCTHFGMEKKQIPGDGMVTGYGTRRFSERKQCCKDRKSSTTGIEKRCSHHRAQRLGGSSYTRRCKQSLGICLDLLSKHDSVGSYSSNLRYSRPLRRRSLLLSRPHRFHLHGKREEPYVHHRS